MSKPLVAETVDRTPEVIYVYKEKMPPWVVVVLAIGIPLVIGETLLIVATYFNRGIMFSP